MKYKPKNRDSSLGLAPMIDIVFLLLIFFLVSSTLQGEEAIYNITVPDSSIGQRADGEQINIFLSEDNIIYYQEVEYNPGQLEILFRDIGEREDRSVKIYADRKTDFENLVFLIEELKENNFERISFSLRERR